MKKITPNGPVIKKLREHLERGATQKELAHTIGVSERQLRSIENCNAPISVATLDRLAKALGAHRDQIAYAIYAPKLVPSPGADLLAIVQELAEEKLVPRNDSDLAYATMDEATLYTSASRSHDLATHIEVQFTEETGAYAEELIELLSSLTWSQRNILVSVPPTEEIAARRRIRHLLVLLKGNDVWVYQTDIIRRLPERYTVAPPDEPAEHQFRLYVAFGPPGEYGETSLRIPVDHGQPFILPAWPSLKSRRRAGE